VFGSSTLHAAGLLVDDGAMGLEELGLLGVHLNLRGGDGPWSCRDGSSDRIL
jgi:hypothetical protein